MLRTIVSRARVLRASIMAAAFAIAWGGASANAVTIASFSDPTLMEPPPVTAMFTVSAGQLTGGWAGTGLMLETLVGDFTDVTFEVTAPDEVSPVMVFGGLTGPGVVIFRSNAMMELMRITFDSGFLAPVSFGATEFFGTGVTFSGSVLPFITSEESFAFAFANQRGTGPGDFSATASFTSSATPEPASFALLASGLVLLRRRRPTV